MNLLPIVEKINFYNVNKLVEKIDRDWYLNNKSDLMGIGNQQFLCNYIEDNINKDTGIIRDGYIQDVIQVSKLDFRNLSTPNFKQIKNLPDNYLKIYYSLIGRIDSSPVDVTEFLNNIDLYRVIITHIFPNYKIEFTGYRLYSLTRLLGGIIRYINIQFVNGQIIPNNVPLLSMKDVYNYRQYLDVLIDSFTDFTIPGNDKLYVIYRYIEIVALLEDDLDSFGMVVDKSKSSNGIEDPVYIKYWYEHLDYPTEGIELQFIQMYGTNLMALVCALGKLDFLKYLVTKPERFYPLVETTAGYEVDKYIIKKYGTGNKTYGRGDFLPKAFQLIPHNKYFDLFGQSRLKNGSYVETYLSISLKYNHQDITRYLLDHGYPMQDGLSHVYDITKDIQLYCTDKQLADTYMKYINLNRALSYQLLTTLYYESNIKDLIEQGANPNVILYNSQIPILYTLLNKDIAEFLVKMGASLEFLTLRGTTSVFYIRDMKAFNLCKKYNVDFNRLDFSNQCILNNFIEVNEKFEVAKALMDELTDDVLNRRGYTRASFLFELVKYRGRESLKPYLDRFNLDIFNYRGLDALQEAGGFVGQTMLIPTIRYLFNRGVRGILAYKKPMFYLPKKNSDCPNEETVGLIETNNPEDDTIIMFKDFGYSEATHRHKQEPMCIAISELNELYFKLRPNTEEFEWNLPTTRRTHRLGSEQLEDAQVLDELINMGNSIWNELPETDPKKANIRGNINIIVQNRTRYFSTSTDYYKQNVAVFKTLNTNQLKLLETLMLMVFKLGEFMRRWGGDEETTLKLYGKADNFPYPMRLLEHDKILMSDGTDVNLLYAYNLHILIRSRDYPRDKPTGIVPYAEDMSAEQLSVIDHFINNYFSVKDNEDILNNNSNSIWDILIFIRKETKLDLRIILNELNPELPISDILKAVEDNKTININLTIPQMQEHMQKRIAEVRPLEKFYKNIFEYTMSSYDLSIVSTNRRIYHTLDAIRPRSNGTVDEAALGDCIQLKNHDFILTAYKYFETFVPSFTIEGFDIKEFRPMHY